MLLDLCRQGLRIGDVAVEHLDGDRTAVGRAEQAIDNLQRAPAAVAARANEMPSWYAQADIETVYPEYYALKK
jgi:hypothetical protein